MGKLSLGLIGFLQAVGLTAYCSLVGILFLHGNKLFGRKPGFMAPVLFLTVFCTSALISALITLGYPIILIWKKKQTIEALKLVTYTAGWLIVFIFIGISFILLFKYF